MTRQPKTPEQSSGETHMDTAAAADTQTTKSDAVMNEKQVHAVLKQSMERYRAAFEYTGTGMMIINDDMTIVALNKRMVETTGYTHAEIEGIRKWVDFVSEADRQRMIGYHQKRRIDPRSVPLEYEFQFRNRTGVLIDALVTVSMVPGTKNSLVSMIDITGRKNMERALRQSEEKYRELFENANDIIYTHDVKGYFTSANSAALQTYGYTLEEITQLNIKDIVASEFHSLINEQMNFKVTTGMTTQSYDILTYTKNRRPVWLEVHSRPIVKDDVIVGIQGIVRDVTERKTVEQKLAEEQQRFRETLEVVPSIICEIDCEMNFIYVNKTGLERFGYSEKDITNGVKIFTFVLPEDQERMMENISYLLSTDSVHSGEYRLQHRNGSFADYIATASRIKRKGEIKGIRCCLVDISERKRMEQQLKKNEQRLRSVFSASPIGIATFDSVGHCIQMNPAFRAMFGLNTEVECRNVGFSLFEHVIDKTECVRKLQTGEPLHFETSSDFAFTLVESQYRITKVTKRTLEWHVTPMGDASDGSLVFLTHVQDVTEKKRLEEARLHNATLEANRMIEGLRKEILQQSQFNNMVSRSPAMQKIFSLLAEIAQTSTSVLINGESGTGKELVARSIHSLGDRKDKPFVAINCGALPDTLLESELFGYYAGAFTDAKKDKPGKFSIANGGTIFLDEIGDISQAMQVKLLRVLQERTFEPLGATKSVSIDVRILSATNKNLLDMVKSGSFREDLYYRIKVIGINLPPLRDRKCDIPLLVDHFISLYNARFKKNVKELSPQALDLLYLHNYPGNIRELENILEHAFIFCKGEVLQPQHLPLELQSQSQPVTESVQSATVTVAQESRASTFDSVGTLQELEKMFIERMLEKSGGSKTKTAMMLNMHKTTLFRKMRSLGIE